MRLIEPHSQEKLRTGKRLIPCKQMQAGLQPSSGCSGVSWQRPSLPWVAVCRFQWALWFSFTSADLDPGSRLTWGLSSAPMPLPRVSWRLKISHKMNLSCRFTAFSDSVSLTERQSIGHFLVLIVSVSFVCLLKCLTFCFSFSLHS